MRVRPLSVSDADACDRILLTLPYFFGNPDGRAACARAVRTQPGWIAEADTSEPVTSDNYEGTRRFYTSLGFHSLKEVGLRDWDDEYALLMVRVVAPGDRSGAP